MWFSLTERKRRSLHDLLFAISTLSKSPASEDQPDDTRRASKRAKLTAVEEDVGVFKNVRLSHEELPMEPLKPLDLPNPSDYDFLDPLNTSNPANHDSPYHASAHRNLNPYSSNLPDPTLDSDAKAVSPPASPPKQDGDGISGFRTRGPVEFNHAISYINKLKRQLASQPDIYKQFLKILQVYQRESGPIQDVYAQVTKLFHSAPDLLEDFNQFLPESASQTRAQAGQTNIYRGAPVQQGDVTPRMQHSVQPPTQQSMQPGPLGTGQGQQSILNVSPY